MYEWCSLCPVRGGYWSLNDRPPQGIDEKLVERHQGPMFDFRYRLAVSMAV